MKTFIEIYRTILDFTSGIPVNILRITDTRIVHTSLIIRWKKEQKMPVCFFFFNVKRKMKEVCKKEK